MRRTTSAPTPAPAFHLYLPQMRLDFAAILDRAVAAEAAGFEGIAFMDHLAPPLAPDQDMWEAMTVAAWVLARTRTLVVGHLVLCDALRHPAVLARQATSLDHASGGRFELGLGWGSVPAELERFGVGSTRPSDRVGRLSESLQIMEALWSGEVVDHRGEHFTLVAAQQRPVPARRIPLTLGGVGPRTLELVRRHADWWNVPAHEIDRLDALADRTGEARVSVQQLVVLLESEADRERWLETIGRRYGATRMASHVRVGTADELIEHYRAQHARGVDRFYVWLGDFAPPETLRRFATVIAGVRGAVAAEG